MWRIGETLAPLPPCAPGWPLLGNALAMRGDVTRYIVETYQRLGPIFRIRILNREVVVMAGIDANRFASQEDYAAFTNRPMFQGVTLEMGSRDNILTLDGPAHQHLRKTLRTSYSRSLISTRLDAVVRIASDFVDALPVGRSFEVFPAMRRLVMSQLGTVMLGVPPADSFKEFDLFMKFNVGVNMFQLLPRWTLRLPRYRRAHAQVMEMAQRVVAFHRMVPSGAGRQRSAIDDLLAGRDECGEPYPESLIHLEAILPYVAALDTVAGTLSFLLYVFVHHRHVLEQVLSELDACFANGVPDAQDFKKMETLHKAIVETMRLYPVAPFMPRTVGQTFEFAGRRVDVGTYAYTAHAVTHFLPQYYPEPYRFDLQRGRGPAGTFVPYGVGNHACLGAGMADVQVLATIAALLHRGTFELDPPGYKLEFESLPLPNPKKLRLKLARRRGRWHHTR